MRPRNTTTFAGVRRTNSMRSLRRSALRCVGTAKRRCASWLDRDVQLRGARDGLLVLGPRATRWCSCDGARAARLKQQPSNNKATTDVVASASEVGDIGFEPTPKTPRETQVSDSDGNKSGNNRARFRASTAPDRPADPDLAALVAAWPALPSAVRAGVAAGGGEARESMAAIGGTTKRRRQG